MEHWQQLGSRLREIKFLCVFPGNNHQLLARQTKICRPKELAQEALYMIASHSVADLSGNGYS